MHGEDLDCDSQWAALGYLHALRVGGLLAVVSSSLLRGLCRSMGHPSWRNSSDALTERHGSDTADALPERAASLTLDTGSGSRDGGAEETGPPFMEVTKVAHCATLVR